MKRQSDRAFGRVIASALRPRENSDFEIDFQPSITSTQVILHVAQLVVHVQRIQFHQDAGIRIVEEWSRSRLNAVDSRSG